MRDGLESIMNVTANLTMSRSLHKYGKLSSTVSVIDSIVTGTKQNQKLNPNSHIMTRKRERGKHWHEVTDISHQHGER